MSDQPKPRRPLSEISHLFLSSVRQRQTNGATPPKRIPPKPAKDSVDLSPEELQLVAQPAAQRTPPVSAVLASHLNGKAFDQVKRYARSLAGTGLRVGLIEIDASEFRLMSFDLESAEDPAVEVSENFDLRAMSDAVTEMSCDIDRWLLMVCSPRLPEARAILREAEQWVLLSTCDSDGVLCAYRTLKGLSDLGQRRLSLAVLDSKTPDSAEQVLRKLTDVCGQFLNWNLEPDRIVRDEPAVAEHGVMVCRPMKDKAQIAAGAHWQLVRDFLAQSKGIAAPATVEAPVDALDDVAFEKCEAEAEEIAPADEPTPQPEATTMQPSEPLPPEPVTTPSTQIPEVVELQGTACDEAAILAAVLHHPTSDLAETSVRPPMCAEARLAVSREHRLVLLAVQKAGAASLRSIAAAFRWVNENRQLVAMALPQFAIDSHQLPHLRLLIDQSDANAELLQPMLQTGSVTVQTYRRLRWNGKMGLLLEAA